MTSINEADAVIYRLGQLGGGAASKVYAGAIQVWPPLEAPSAAYRSLIMGTAGLVGYWRLNEPSNTSPLIDETGVNFGDYANYPTLGVPGIWSDQTAMKAGPPGFEAGHAVVRSPLHRVNGIVPQWRGPIEVDPNAMAILDLGDGPLTIEAWIQPGPPIGGPFRGIVSKGGGTYYLRLDGGNSLRWVASAVADMGGSTIPVPSTGWHHIVGTKHGAALKLYINGVDVTGPMVNVTLIDSDNWLGIGADNQGGWTGEVFKGDLDEVALYNVVLTPAQVLEHFQARM